MIKISGFSAYQKTWRELHPDAPLVSWASSTWADSQPYSDLRDTYTRLTESSVMNAKVILFQRLIRASTCTTRITALVVTAIPFAVTNAQ